jgi:hypothetical protein
LLSLIANKNTEVDDLKRSRFPMMCLSNELSCTTDVRQ